MNKSASQKIKITNLDFGKIDARQEILSRDPAKRKLFLESFYAPKSFSIDELKSGEKFLIVGPKGSGKTALLRYLEHTLNQNDNSHSRFIVFRDEVTTQDRDKLINLSAFRMYDVSSPEAGEETFQDCLDAWQLFIHREIAQVLSTTQNLVAKTPDVQNYINLLNSFFSSYKTSTFKKLLKKVTRGRVKLSGFGQSLEMEASFIDSHGNIDISEFVRYCNGVVKNLHFNEEQVSPRINIFFDEVNISFVSNKKFKSDAILIRDLVAASGVLNTLFAEHSLPIYIYTALRSEVADSVEASVREMSKLIDDKSVTLDWYIPNKRYRDQPIINLLEHRIRANIVKAFGKESKRKFVLEDYFETKIFQRPFSDFLVFETWGRPRDLVRILGEASKYVGQNNKFSSEVFRESAGEYSKSCWNEKSDELNSKYSQTEVETIKRLLSNLESSFSRTQFDVVATQQSSMDNRTNHFLTGRSVEVLLEDLYNVGIIGNIHKSPTGKNIPKYKYMGHSTFSHGDIICVHRSLLRELGIAPAAKKPRRVPSKGKRRS
ncbi:P-loop ATPase, Sll1717 family [Aliiroseovarius crassostreae]|uniref:P-loop ATPase, Sll1717 family n=1 Tax=Aliiroseovarius crassostreae TaxID=154981 RepID=UPI0021FA3B7E|nr:hypothetical protein [Aliiroseovarius crassostreae]UWQ08870.1 hypothetical protein K3X25_04630 [Aliiroseovarius crassostreae]